MNKKIMRIGMALSSIVLAVDDVTLTKIESYIKDIENTVLEIAKESENNQKGTDMDEQEECRGSCANCGNKDCAWYDNWPNDEDD